MMRRKKKVLDSQFQDLDPKLCSDWGRWRRRRRLWVLLLTWISHSLFIHRPSSLWSAGSESAVNNSNYCIIAATSIVLNSLWSPQCLWSLTHLIIMPMNVKKGDQSHNFKITWMWTRNQSAGPGKLKTVSKVWECCKCKVWVSPRSMLVVWESPFKCNFPVIAHFQIK